MIGMLAALCARLKKLLRCLLVLLRGRPSNLKSRTNFGVYNGSPTFQGDHGSSKYLCPYPVPIFTLTSSLFHRPVLSTPFRAPTKDPAPTYR